MQSNPPDPSDTNVAGTGGVSNNDKRHLRSEMRVWSTSKHIFKKFQVDAKIYNTQIKPWRDFPPPEGESKDPRRLFDYAYRRDCERRKEDVLERLRLVANSYLIAMDEDLHWIDRAAMTKSPGRHTYLRDIYGAEHERLSNVVKDDFGGVKVQLHYYAMLYVRNVLVPNKFKFHDVPTVAVAFALTNYRTADGYCREAR